MKEIIILAAVFILGSMAIHFRQRLLDEKDMRELERYFFNEILKKCIKAVPKENKELLSELKEITKK